MASLGHAWQDEIQSFLPHALDCVDPSCLLPLCVNLKLTLRHIQQCERSDQCTICQGMKSLASTHSNSCRDFFCRVPFCMEAKVTTQRQILMDQLVSPRAELHEQEHNDPHNVETKNCTIDTLNSPPDPAMHIPEIRKPTTPEQLTAKKNDEGSDESESQDVVWVATKCLSPNSQVGAQVLKVSDANTVQPESTVQSDFLPVIKESSTSFQSSSQISNKRPMASESVRPVPSPKSSADPLKPPCLPGTKRKLTSFISTNNRSIPAPKAYCSATDVTSSQSDDCSGGKRYSSISELSKASLKHVASKRTSPRPYFSRKRRPTSDSSNLRSGTCVSKGNIMDASWDGTYASSKMDLQTTDDSKEPCIDDLFSTPPPSPTFEMWFGEPVQTNDTVLKSVLLDTLFQLLGVVTQPKTKQQEAIFVDLLERTLRVMKTEIAKQ